MHTKCFIKNCSTVRSKNITFFRATQKSGRLEKWKNAIPPENGELKEDCFICEVHFEPKFAPRFLEIRFFHRIDYYPKNQISLTKNAIPTIFDEKTMQKRKVEIHNDILLKTKSKVSLVFSRNENDQVSVNRVTLPCSTRSVMQSIENVPVPSLPDTNSNEKSSEIEIIPLPPPILVDLTLYDFETLKSEIQLLKLPMMWSYSAYRDLTVMLIKWNFNFRHVVKQILITSNLDCKVFVDKNLITIESLPAIQSLSAIEKIVKVVDDLPVVPRYDFSRRKLKNSNSMPLTLSDFHEAFKKRIEEIENNNSMIHLR